MLYAAVMVNPSQADSGSPPFLPAWWLPGAHFQTLWGPVTRRRNLVSFTREVVPTPDGDEIILDHLDGPAGSPRVLILHGLEGSSYSVYVQGLLRRIAERGWRGTAMNFRSCARDPRNIPRMLPNLRPRFYHSGETSDPDLIIRMLWSRDPSSPMAAVGASLGANVLLKWLGENPEQRLVAAAAAVSAPFDLAAGSRHLESGIGPLYVHLLLETLRPKALAAAQRFSELTSRMDPEAIRRASTFQEFDDAATAPLHGFADAADYYSRCSAIGFLPEIRTPTLCISSVDDPFLPGEVVSQAQAAASSSVEFLVTGTGGHIGFVSGSPRNARYWAEERTMEWLEARLGER